MYTLYTTYGVEVRIGIALLSTTVSTVILDGFRCGQLTLRLLNNNEVRLGPQ